MVERRARRARDTEGLMDEEAIEVRLEVAVVVEIVDGLVMIGEQRVSHTLGRLVAPRLPPRTNRERRKRALVKRLPHRAKSSKNLTIHNDPKLEQKSLVCFI